MDDSNNKRSFEVIIVGAGTLGFPDQGHRDSETLMRLHVGISGIIAAQRYLEAHPKCRLTLLEKDYCIGGVFSTSEGLTHYDYRGFPC